ncbi:MAG: hypothetical protein FWF87_00465 [Synergistaceae bacterium]|nr:hypothetical protein [Synergistaceae bacterium]
MSIRKMFLAFTVILLLVSVAFAFPYDPNPSEIDGTLPALGTVTTPSATNLFPGTWSRTFASNNAQSMRLHNYMVKEFAANGGPGGVNDMKIWNTPSFSEEKMKQQNDAWAFKSANPGTAVPASVGVSMFTTHSELVACIEAMPRTNMTVEYLGEIPRGFPFPMLVFSNLKKHPTIAGGVDAKDRSPAELKKTKKPLVWIQGNIHGGEWSGGEGALACAYDLANGRYNDLLDKVNVIVVPRVTADGAKVPRRETHDLVALQWTPVPEARDLNRDNVLLDHHVTRSMRKMNMAYGPHFAIDLHERNQEQINSSATSFFGVKFDWDAGDISAGGTTILQTPKELSYLRYKYVEPDLSKFAEQYSIYMGSYIVEGFDDYSSGLGSAYQVWNNYVPSPDDTVGGPYGPYSGRGISPSGGGVASGGTWVNSQVFDPDSPFILAPEGTYNHRSSRNINSMPGVISQLFENRSYPQNTGSRGMWERRVATGYVCMLSTISTAANRGEVIVPLLEEMRTRWAEKGKVYDPTDMIPILTIPHLPTYWNETIDQGDGFPYERGDLSYWAIDIGTTGTVPNASADDIVGVTRFNLTKSIKKGVVEGRPTFNMGGEVHSFVLDGSGEGRYQPLKTEILTQGWNLRERARPTAYIFEGPYAEEVASRMLIAGINVKRLAKDVTVNVTGWKFNARPTVDFRNSGGGGWGSNNRNVTLFDIPNRPFKKDVFVVFLSQLMTHLIPMYLEPDMPFSAGNGIMLQYMSVALGGAGTGALSPNIVGVEMPIYRYIGDVNALQTYDMDFFLPLINRGAVPRFFSFHTQEELAAIAAACGKYNIKAYDYDIQVHARAGRNTTAPALKDRKFDMILPTSEGVKNYLIQKIDGSYEVLPVQANKMVGWDVATIDVDRHGQKPFTVDLASNDRPAVGDGSDRTLPVALPTWDDLIGVRIVEVMASPILDLFKDGKLPKDAVLTETGIKYTEMLSGTSLILCEGMLDGWEIIGSTPHSGANWKSSFAKGQLHVKFTGDAYDQAVTVTLQKIGTTETMDIEIKFSGEKESIWDRIFDKAGCNAGALIFALLALCPLFMRRKG